MCKNAAVIVVPTAILLVVAGCVERELTITTEPAGALVELNDEPIGAAPVTVSFNWYGDYNVRITRDGYETLATNRELRAPLHDYFPFDFFVQILYPGRITDSYHWSFTLEPKRQISREQLIQDARQLRDALP